MPKALFAAILVVPLLTAAPGCATSVVSSTLLHAHLGPDDSFFPRNPLTLQGARLTNATLVVRAAFQGGHVRDLTVPLRSEDWAVTGPLVPDGAPPLSGGHLCVVVEASRLVRDAEGHPSLPRGNEEPFKPDWREFPRVVLEGDRIMLFEEPDRQPSARYFVGCHDQDVGTGRDAFPSPVAIPFLVLSWPITLALDLATLPVQIGVLLVLLNGHGHF